MLTEQYCRKLLKEAGVDPARFSLDWASAAEAPLYVDLIKKFTEQVRNLGSLGTSEGIPLEELKANLAAAKSVASNMKLRTRFARLTQELRKENDYSPQFMESKLSEKLLDAMSKEMEKQRRIP